MVLVLKKKSTSCFRFLRIASTLPFLLLMSASMLLIPTQVCCGSPQTEAVSDDGADAVNALIRDLRDPKFAVREAATHRLMEVGSPAVAALQLASGSDSLEVRVRVQTILASILQDRDSSFGSSQQAVIKKFKDAEAVGRVEILKAEATPEEISLFLHLLDIIVVEEANSTTNDQEESPIETLLGTETSNPLSRLISRLLTTPNWSDLEKILTHPGILKYSPMLRVNEAQKAGEFDVYVEDRFQKFSQARAAEEAISQRELISLVGLLRVQRDFERAETVIGWLSDVDLQSILRNEVLFQQGNWQEISRRAKLDPTAPEFISTNLMQEALLHHLNGDTDAVAEVKQQLRQQLQAATETAEAGDAPEAGNVVDEGAGSVKLIRNYLRVVGAITLDWPLVVEFFEPDDPAGNVNLMIASNRATEAFELLEIPPDFKGRKAWMEDTLKEIDEAREAAAKRSGRRNDEESLRLTKLISDKSRLMSSVAEVMEQRGMDDEAQLYLQMIYAAGQSSSHTLPTVVLDDLIQLGRTDDYWQLVASILRDPNYLNIVTRENWFGLQDSSTKKLAVEWASRIRGAINDPLEKTKVVAAVMNSPWVNREELGFDLDFEIARYRSRSSLNATGGVEFMLAQVLELNGRDEAANQMLQQAAMLGEVDAIQRGYQQAVAANDDRGILKYWTDAYEKPTATCLVTRRAALKLLESETDPSQIKNIERQLKLCRLAIAAQWFGAGNAWDGEEFSLLLETEESHLAAFRLQCMAYGVSGDLLNKERHRRQLGNALASKKANQAFQGGIELAKVMFEELSYATGVRADLQWSYYSMQLNLVVAQGMIERKEYDKAADLLVRQVQFFPGDVSVGEATVKKLDQVGETVAADRVYQAVEKYFVESLEMYPESPLSRNNYAWLSATSYRDLEMARRHASVAVKVRPNQESYLDTLAEVEFLLGRPKAAFELSKRCIQLNPERAYYRQQKERFRKAMSAAE